MARLLWTKQGKGCRAVSIATDSDYMIMKSGRNFVLFVEWDEYARGTLDELKDLAQALNDERLGRIDGA